VKWGVTHNELDVRVFTFGQNKQSVDLRVQDLVVVCLATQSQRVLVQVDIIATTRGDNEHIVERHNALADDALSNICALANSVVEHLSGTLLLVLVVTLLRLVLAVRVGSLLDDTGDIKAHLHKLVGCAGLLAILGSRSACRWCELDGNLRFACNVGVGDKLHRKLEGGFVGHEECKVIA